jgi:hypothetical protein
MVMSKSSQEGIASDHYSRSRGGGVGSVSLRGGGFGLVFLNLIFQRLVFEDKEELP